MCTEGIRHSNSTQLTETKNSSEQLRKHVYNTWWISHQRLLNPHPYNDAVVFAVEIIKEDVEDKGSDAVQHDNDTNEDVELSWWLGARQQAHISFFCCFVAHRGLDAHTLQTETHDTSQTHISLFGCLMHTFSKLKHTMQHRHIMAVSQLVGALSPVQHRG